MKQLMFDDNFYIVDEPIPYWKSISDVPSKIIDFINNYDSSACISDTFTCCICGCLLRKDFFCPSCLEYSDDYKLGNDYSYYIFDVLEGETILYRVVENRIIYTNSIQRVINLVNAFHIEKDGIRDYYTDEFYTKFVDSNKCVLYTDNFDLLKDGIYKYTYLWEAWEFLKSCELKVGMLCFIPFKSKHFDMLMKNHLFRLPFYDLDKFNGNTFMEVFGVDRKFLKFMKEHDITYKELEALRVCGEDDYELVTYTVNNMRKINTILDLVNISVRRIRDYLDNDYNDIDDYIDYLRFAKSLGIDLGDKKYLFPEYLFLEHEKLRNEVMFRNNPEIDRKIQFISNVLSINRYEDDKYVIFPARDVQSMFDEATQQDNCLVSYCERYGDNDMQIYFMREKSKVPVEKSKN